jgi:ribonuclease-3
MTGDARPRDERPLTERLGLADVDADLLRRALTHRSWASEHDGEEHNERLELLGDAVLGLVVTAELHRRDPVATEGVLSRRRAALVREGSLAAAARAVGIGEALRLGRGEATSGGADKDSLLADTLEAIIGAAFLTGGYGSAEELVLLLLGEGITATGDGDDPQEGPAGPVDAKTALQERLAALRLASPEYMLTREGPDHAPTFHAEVVVDDEVLGVGSGGSKKAASQMAAEQALRHRTLG